MTRATSSGALFKQSHFHMANPLTDFLYWASKTDRRLLRLCTPFTQMTHTARGFFVLATAVFALASSYYTLTTIASGSATLALPLSLLWASVIFMVDRELVGHWSRRSLWLRVGLAFILGMLVAIPAEVRMLEGRIDHQILNNNNVENSIAIKRLRDRQQDADRSHAAP